ncbi:MAG: hypothetical protein V4581_12545 [Bacteroidota bacterium]
MKKYFLLFIAVFALSSFTGSEKEFDIVGRWESTVEGEVFIFTFEKDGYAFLQKGDVTMGGKEFEIAGEKASLTYTVDYIKTPHQLDIVVTRLAANEKQTMLKGIFKVQGDNEMLLVMGPERPVSLEGAEALVFKRK